ncbi:MAG: fibronectin type III domain-containing protein [Candidatus Cloacimonetes bacterium]|nr:fibronectin type III domain-containing protein [Candidatus Cloacimonadota bacterium]
MKTRLAFLFFVAAAISLNAYLIETESLSKFIYGQASGTAYDNWLSHVVEGIASPGYNVYAPYDRQLTGFGNYRHPTETELDRWGVLVDALLADDLTAADNLIAEFGFPYEVVEFHDTRSGRTFIMLREIPDWDYVDNNGTTDTYDDENGAFGWGWGLYVINTDPDALPLIVTTPHINDDYPTTPLSCQAFLDWNARFWLVSGVGREVWWNDDGQGYTNSKSLSDPTRREAHAFNVTYQAMCDNIRDETGERELSVQIHSSDWASHLGYATCQIAAGRWGRDYPTLPIRDFSSQHMDMINATPWVVHPPNSVGIHDEVTVSDYYGVWYTSDGFYYYMDGDSVEVSNNIDLPGYTNNRQLIYSCAGLNVYDAREPFYHIEFDELPWIYGHTEQNWHWFCGWDAITERWHMGHLFDRFFDYYTPWLDAMGAVLPAYFEFDDNETPPTPGNFAIHSVNSNSVTLSWDRSDSYDFSTYMIRYSDEPLSGGNYAIYDRDDRPNMASLATTETKISALDPNTQYYFAMQAVDDHGHISPLSEEFTCFTGPARIQTVSAQGMSDWVYLKWTVQNQYECLGFVVDRAVDDPNNPYETIASWADHDSLQGSAETNVTYIFNDHAVGRDTTYYYKVSAVWSDSTVAHNNHWEAACPQIIWELVVSNTAGTIADTVRFARNRFAANGYDLPYDILHGSFPTGSYIHAMFYEQYWNNGLRELYQETYAEFDPETELKRWRLRTRSNQYNQTLTIELREVSAGGDRNGEKLYLQHGSTWHDLQHNGAYEFTVSNTSWIDMYIHWGDMQPDVSFTQRSNRFYSTGDDIPINWATQHRFVVDYFDLYAHNETDSVFIAANLPETTSSYTWDAPDTLLTDLHIVVRAVFPDGTWTDYQTTYRLGIFPNTMDITFNDGWQLRTNPIDYPEVTWFPPEMVELWRYLGDDAYAVTDTFAFSEAYWLHSDELYTIAGLVFPQIREESTIWPLRSGWNLVPNLFMEELATKDQTFVFGGASYTFAEAVQQGFVCRAVYVYRDGYESTYNVHPEESYFIYSFVENLDMWCVPFNDNPGYEFFRDGWQLDVHANSGSDDTARLVVGTNQFTSLAFDPLYDLPKPPRKPTAESIGLFIVKDGQFAPYPDSLFHQEFKLPLGDDPEVPESWDFILCTSNLDPVTFTADRSLFPTDYGVLVEMNGVNYSLSYDLSFEFTPADTVTWGQLHIYDHPVGNGEDVVPHRLALSNWPNPFNPETTIGFSLPAPGRTRIDIYNIRGQRVCTLVDDTLSAGPHRIVWSGRNDNGRQVATGVYFYRLRSGNITRTRKMLLIK